MIRIFLLVGVLLMLAIYLITGISSDGEIASLPKQTYKPKFKDPATEVRNYLPESRLGDVVHHQHYSLSYSEEHEQAEWVAYTLTREMVQNRNVERTDWFEQDPAVKGKSAHFEDYRNSGFTKGHLVPAADMAFSQVAMEETFLMSNITPQDRAFNNGVWRELEESVRDWASKYGRLYIVSGPTLDRLFSQRIGRNQVAVPAAFYKVILINEPGAERAVGFLIPNTKSERPLNEYIVSVDEIEKETGLDFFEGLMDKNVEDRIEAYADTKLWPFSLMRFQKRLNSWNN